MFQIACTTNGGDPLLEREKGIKTDRHIPRLRMVLASLMSEPQFQLFGVWDRVIVEKRLCSSLDHFCYIINV